jgi:cyclic pyranopterin phosphate synthase
MSSPSSVSPILDILQRPLRDLRISVTDRCNYRCSYCMPNERYTWIKRQEILTFEEIERLASVFLQLGVEKIRLTGGEPLVRQDLERLVARLATLPGLHDLSLTTNASLLAPKALALKAAGLTRINVSLDTLRPDRFKTITQRDDHAAVMAGIFAARDAGFAPIKLNAVILRGVNDDEVLDLLQFAREHGFEIRFIEYMDVGNANGWSLERTFPKQEILDRIRQRWPLRETGRDDGRAPAVDYAFEDGTGELGVIGSVTEPFCGSCSRLRLTADGKLVTCLFSASAHDLKGPLRSGATDEQIASLVRGLWERRTDRYSEERWEAIRSGVPYRPEDHRKIEMITLGG